MSERMRMGRHAEEVFILKDCEILRESDNAILVSVREGDAQEDAVWIPTSQVYKIVRPAPTAPTYGTEITMSRWIASRKELLIDGVEARNRDLARRIEEAIQVNILLHRELAGARMVADLAQSLLATERGDEKWFSTRDGPPPPERELLVGYWYHEPLKSGVGHHTVCKALREASYQVCYFASGYFWAFYCGGFDAQLVPATKWRRLKEAK